MDIERLKRYLSSFVTVALLICCFSITASAEWDGQGLPSGGSASAATGSFKLPYDDINDITGYRFSVYDI